MEQAKTKKGTGHYTFQWLLRTVFDFYIWADDSHVYIVISGSTWWYKFSDERFEFLLVAEIGRTFSSRRYAGCIIAFANSRFDSHGYYSTFLDHAGNGIS